MSFNKHPSLVSLLIVLSVLQTTNLYAITPPKDDNYADYNLILISLGNVGTKYMSLYGYGRNTTPFLDEWTKDAIVFSDTFVPASWTLPVATSLFTSLQPYSHNVYHRRHDNILNTRIATFPEILKKNGYATAAFTGGLDYAPKFGHMRGLAGPSNPMFSSFGLTFNQSLSWLKVNKDKKFFLFVHGYDSHCPFNPPPPFKGTFSSKEDKDIDLNLNLCYRGWETSEKGKYSVSFTNKVWWDENIILDEKHISHLRDLYDEEVLLEDYLLGRFLNSIDPEVLAKTIIVIFADHGELFAKQGRFGRAGVVRGTYDDVVIQVPLIIKLPGKAGKQVNGLVQIIDLMPTLLTLLDLPVPKHAQGRNLMPLVNTGKEINKYVYGGTKYWPTVQYHYLSSSEYIRDNEWKLVRESRRKIKLDFEWLKRFKVSNDKNILSAYYNYIDKQEIHPAYIDPAPEVTYQLYNLLRDPDETENLYEKESGISRKLSQEMDKWLERTTSFDLKNTSKKIFSDDKSKMIREHGYW